MDGLGGTATIVGTGSGGGVPMTTAARETPAPVYRRGGGAGRLRRRRRAALLADRLIERLDQRRHRGEPILRVLLQAAQHHDIDGRREPPADTPWVARRRGHAP